MLASSSKLLALPRPWAVDFVDFDSKAETIDVFLCHRTNARFRCPECGVVLPLYDHVPPRRWRHLDHGSWLTWLGRGFHESPVCFMASGTSLFPGRRREDAAPWPLRNMRSIYRQRGIELEDPDSEKNAYGFRNREHMKIAIYFHCGGLDLYPK